jgi:hypothetical protein
MLSAGMSETVADMKGAGASAGDFERCVIGVGCGGVAKRELAVRRAKRTRR